QLGACAESSVRNRAVGAGGGVGLSAGEPPFASGPSFAACIGGGRAGRADHGGQPQLLSVVSRRGDPYLPQSNGKRTFVRERGHGEFGNIRYRCVVRGQWPELRYLAQQECADRPSGAGGSIRARPPRMSVKSSRDRAGGLQKSFLRPAP